MNDKSLQTVATALSGYELLNDPLHNKGTAFTEHERAGAMQDRQKNLDEMRAKLAASTAS